MAEPHWIGTPATERSGMTLTYIRRRGVLQLHGWYDGGWGGIETQEFPLGVALRMLGITRADVHRALADTPVD